MSGAAQSAVAGGTPHPAGSLKGLISMAAAMALFITNDTLLKLALRDLPLGETLAIRTFVSALFLLAIAAHAGDLKALTHSVERRVMLRSSMDTATTLLYVAALGALPIATSTTIYMAAPLMTTALAVPLLGEKVGWKSWSAIALGFAGAVIVTRPDPDTFSAIALLPLMAAFCGSLRDIITRGISMQVPGSVVGLASSVMLTLVCLVFAAWEPWRMPAAIDLAYLLGAAAAFAGGSLCLVHAFRNAPVASVSPLRYLLVLGALISGYFVFGDLPDAWTTAGILLVVGAGLYALQVEHRRSREARRAARSDASGACVMGPAACAPPQD